MHMQPILLDDAAVAAALHNHDDLVLDAVRRAYEAHHRGHTSLPHSNFLRFPDHPQNRIIALPAYLGEDFRVAGIKWIASFPNNISRGLNRASATMILNSIEDGRPIAIMDAALISARRTASSAALAAAHLHGDAQPARVGLVGAGPIQLEILRFLKVVFPALEACSVLDLDADRARRFCRDAETAYPGLKAEVVEAFPQLLEISPLISFATTARTPHVNDLSGAAPGTTVLHVSLRDLSPETILDCDNVVDDADHVCRAETSLHLAEQYVGHRDFIRCSIAEIIIGEQPGRVHPDGVTIFSPFGLGVLDLAVATVVLDQARAYGLGLPIPGLASNRGSEALALTAGKVR